MQSMAIRACFSRTLTWFKLMASQPSRLRCGSTWLHKLQSLRCTRLPTDFTSQVSTMWARDWVLTSVQQLWSSTVVLNAQRRTAWNLSHHRREFRSTRASSITLVSQQRQASAVQQWSHSATKAQATTLWVWCVTMSILLPASLPLSLASSACSERIPFDFFLIDHINYVFRENDYKRCVCHFFDLDSDECLNGGQSRTGFQWVFWWLCLYFSEGLNKTGTHTKLRNVWSTFVVSECHTYVPKKGGGHSIVVICWALEDWYAMSKCGHTFSTLQN